MDRGDGSSDPVPLLKRLFVDHPRSLGMSWTGHGMGAAKMGIELIGAGLAALAHAVVPGLFTDTASRIVRRVDGHMRQRQQIPLDEDDRHCS